VRYVFLPNRRIGAMQTTLPPSMPLPLMQKWCALAERRRDHFVRLYENGQWRHYYTESEFLRHSRAAFDLVDLWQEIVATSGSDPASV
jgi:uncharacterized repeat protein (TIGR03809 family)